MEESVTYRGTSAAVVQVLLAARANGVVVNRTKLAKLLYLADLRAVGEGLPPGSDVEWRWRNYGPYSDALRDIESDLETAGVIQRRETFNFYGSPEVRLKLLATEPQVELDLRFAEIVEQVVRDHGRLSATQLKDLTYQTPPMRAALRVGRRELRLDLAGGDPYPDLDAPLARFKQIVKEFPLPEDEPGAVDALARELDDWARLRDEAAARILDE